MTYDVIVIGARCAGSPTAMLLARKGYKVLVVDRASFPSDTVSTHMIWPPGVRALRDWGLLDRLIATNCPPVKRITMDFGFAQIRGTLPPIDGVDTAYGPRRLVLDKLLADAAVEAGAELREGFVVQDLIVDGDRVVGLRGRDKSGATVEERARLVVGADGARSLVAKTVNASVYDDMPPRTFNCYSYWSDFPVDGFCGWGGPSGMVGALPTNDGLTLVNVICPVAGFTAFRENVEENYMKIATSIPAVAERLAKATRTERFVSTADIPNYFRRPWGNGWALVGDAGYHKDPITAQGITDSFRDAGLLAEAADATFAGRRSHIDAFAEYERARNSAVAAMYAYTLDISSMEMQPEDIALLQAFSRSPEACDQFAGGFVGTLPLHQVYGRFNLVRVLGAMPPAG